MFEDTKYFIHWQISESLFSLLIQLNSMNSPQRVSGTYTYSNPEAVIGTLLPKRNNTNATQQQAVPQQQMYPPLVERKSRFPFHRNSSSSAKRSSSNMTNTNVYKEEPEVYQLPPKPQPKRKTSISDSPLLKPSLSKPPAPPPPGTEEKVCVVSLDVDDVKEDLSLTATKTALPPPPRPPKKSLSSSETCSSGGEQSPVSERKLAGKQRSKRTGKSSERERGVHFDPSLPKEEEPPPLPPRMVMSDDVIVPSRDTTSVIPLEENKPPPILSHIVTVEATVEGKEGQETELGRVTPPPRYCIAVEMARLSDSSGDMEDGSDITASTELGHEHDIILVHDEGTIVGSRHSTPTMSCESSC